jgi:hypothetical protein
MELNNLLKYNRVLKNSSIVKYLNECIDFVENCNVIIKYIGQNNAGNLLNFYNERLKIQSITGSKEIIDYEELLLKLEKIKSDEQFDIVHLYTENFGFIILHFFDNNIFFILKNYKMDLKRVEELDQYYSENNFVNNPFVKIERGNVVASNIGL